MLWYNQSFAQKCLLLGTVSKVIDVAYRTLVEIAPKLSCNVVAHGE